MFDVGDVRGLRWEVLRQPGDEFLARAQLEGRIEATFKAQGRAQLGVHIAPAQRACAMAGEHLQPIVKYG
ncbi:MAG: hypothetical protein C4309_07555 [Chloroflexota bacterium]